MKAVTGTDETDLKYTKQSTAWLTDNSLLVYIKVSRYITVCDESTPQLNVKLIQLLMSASNTLFRLKFQV